MRLSICLIIGLALVGCGPREPDGARTVDRTSTNTEGRREPGVGKTGVAPPSVPRPGETITDPPIDNRRFEIRPAGSRPWTPAPQPLKELGRDMDAAISNLDEEICQAEVLFDVDGAKMRAAVNLLVRNRKTLSIEWVDPSTKASVNQMIVNPDHAAYRIDGEWRSGRLAPLKPVGDRDLVSVWAKDALTRMNSAFLTGEPVWQTMLGTISARPADYETTVERSNQKVNEQMREIVRIVAKSKRGGGTIEIVVDGRRNLPLTVKLVQPQGERVDRLLWAGAWARGGRHPDTAFIVPKAPGAQSP